MLNFVFLITSLSNASRILFKYTRTVFNLSTCTPCTFAYELFKLVGILTTLLISSFYLFKQQSPLKQLNQMYQHL